MADPSGDGVYIQVMEPPGGTLALIDSAIPEQGVKFAGELRAVTTRYPGNTQPSTQIMGTQEDDIVLTGWLRDAWIGTVGGAQALFQQMREIWLLQLYCKLVMAPEASTAEAIQREGYIHRVEHEFTSVRAIRYTLTFRVSRAQESSVVAKPFPPAPTSFDLAFLIDAIVTTAAVVTTASQVINALGKAAR